MRRRPGLSSLVAAYPPAWRARYGDELAALAEDLRGSGRRPAALAADLLRGAAVAWLRPKRGAPMSERSRAALYPVLWSWVVFAVTAAWFGHDLGSYPSQSGLARFTAPHGSVARILGTFPSQMSGVVRFNAAFPAIPDAYHVLLAAGVIGVAATAVAAIVFAIDAVRYVHSGGQRRLLWLMAVPPVSAAVWIGGLRLIRLETGSAASAGLAVLWVLAGAAGIAASTQAVITIVRSAELSDRTWRIGGTMAALVTAAMVVATGATIAWGIAAHASLPRTGSQAEWFVTVIVMAVTTGRALIALAGMRRQGRALAGEPATG